MQGFVKFIITARKIHQNDDEYISFLESKMKELFNNNLDEIISILKTKEKEWGNVAVRVNYITKEVIKELELKRIE